MHNFKVMDDVIIVKRDDPESVTAGGIVLPTIAQEEMEQGTIVAKGPGKRSQVGYIPMDINIGDKVLFSKFANLQMTYEGIDYITMREGDIVGVIE